MPQEPVLTTLFVSKIEVGEGLAVTPDSGTGHVLLELAGAAKEIVNTAISTAGAGTLTAAGIVGQLITRTGPVAAFTDTTATAVLIVAAIPGAFAGQSFYINVKNTTAFPQTISGGVGVTITGNTIIPAHSNGTFLLTVTTLTAIALIGTQISPLTTIAPVVTTALTTNGAGALTAAGIAGGVTVRSGATAAFTDTTATADLIIAARPNVAIGDSWEYTYDNTVAFLATLTGGTGVTVSGMTSVPGLCWVKYLVTYTAASTITMVGVSAGQLSPLPFSKLTTSTAFPTLQLSGLTGAQIATMTLGTTGQSGMVIPTASDIVGATPNARVGTSFQVTLRNTQTLTTIQLSGLTGTTISGSALIQPSTARTFDVTLASLGSAQFTGLTTNQL